MFAQVCFHAWLLYNMIFVYAQGCALSCISTCVRAHMLSDRWCVCVLLLSYQSDVNLRFNFQWIIYPRSSLGTCTGQGSENIYHTHTPYMYVCTHTHTHSATTHWHAELYSRSSYKYLSLFRLIFISSNRAHIRGAVGWWRNPERERGREEEVIEREIDR